MSGIIENERYLYKKAIRTIRKNMELTPSTWTSKLNEAKKTINILNDCHKDFLENVDKFNVHARVTYLNMLADVINVWKELNKMLKYNNVIINFII